MSKKVSPPPTSGTIFDSRVTLNGLPAPEGKGSLGHMSVFWEDHGHYSWHNPNQIGGHWTTHTPFGRQKNTVPPGGKVG